MKICRECRIEKDESEFYRNLRDNKSRSICKICQKQYNNYKKFHQIWRHKNKNKCDKNRRKYKYDLCEEIYLEFLEKQNNVCAICHKPETALYKGILMQLCVDHNHNTGEVRGLLCHSCNLRLGILEDAEWCLKANSYLRSNDV